MEVICDDKLRIWHLFFGVPGSRNDINIMNMSPLFQLIRAGKWPPGRPQRQVSWLFVDWFYFLCDSIYPRFRIFATTVGNPRTPREKLYASAQEGVRKSVERVFGVLFARFHILYRPSRLWYKEDMADVVATCCIIHNMIIENSEVQGGTRNIATLDDTALPSDVQRVTDPQGIYERAQFWRSNADMVEDADQHMSLKSALADSMWDAHGNLGEEADH
jgi:Plant transposon protein